eukprot:509465_1
MSDIDCKLAIDDAAERIATAFPEYRHIGTQFKAHCVAEEFDDLDQLIDDFADIDVSFIMDTLSEDTNINIKDDDKQTICTVFHNTLINFRRARTTLNSKDMQINMSNHETVILQKIEQLAKESKSWLEFLLKVEQNLAKYSYTNDILIFSAPYKVSNIRIAIEESYELSFCVDHILDFLLFGYILNKQTKQYDYIYDTLLPKYAIIIINVESNNVITLPRNIDQSSLLKIEMQFINSSIITDFIKQCNTNSCSKVTDQKIQLKITRCTNINSCVALKRLTLVYQQYFQQILVYSSPTMNSYRTMNGFDFQPQFDHRNQNEHNIHRDYAHLRKHHNDQQSYSFIINKLGGPCCDINCNIVRRFHDSVKYYGSGPISSKDAGFVSKDYYVDCRGDVSSGPKYNHPTFDYSKIMDRIHTFYQHTTPKDKIIIFVDHDYRYGGVACTTSLDRIITDKRHALDHIVKDEQTIHSSNNINHNNISNNMSTQISCDNIHECHYLKELQKSMLLYKRNINTNSLENVIDKRQLLNQYLHTISYHNDDASFAVIYDKMKGFCKSQQCELILNDELIQRIHFHFCHTYDYGYRLTYEETQAFESSDAKTNDNTTDDTLFTNVRLSKLTKTLNEKQCKRGYGMRGMRFNTTETDNIQKHNKKEKNKQKDKSRTELYSFGYIFDYPYHHDISSYSDNTPNHFKKEKEWNNPSEVEKYHASYCTDSEFQHEYKHKDWNLRYIGEVKPKFKDLKQELISNPLSALTMQQFNSEYKKAELHFESGYCKANIHNKAPNGYDEYEYYEYTGEYENIDTYEEGFDRKGHYYAGWVRRNYSKQITRKSAKPYPDKFYYYRRRNISIQDILTVMVYCNYDVLQNAFSATFRKINPTQNNILITDRHSNFYWFARLLREIVECFGINVGLPRNYKNKDIIRIFHGIDKQFMFPSICPQINGPFSTSTDYCVATNFCAGMGMVLELGIDTASWNMQCWDVLKLTGQNILPCMDMQWISEYPNEQEIFCVGGLRAFTFHSIIEVSK